MGYQLSQVLEELRVAFNKKLQANGHSAGGQDVVDLQPKDAFHETTIASSPPVKNNSSSVSSDSDSGNTGFVQGFRKFIAMFSRK